MVMQGNSDLPIYASNWLYAVFGYANELTFTNVRLFSISNNCCQFGNDLFNSCRDMGTQYL